MKKMAVIVLSSILLLGENKIMGAQMPAKKVLIVPINDPNLRSTRACIGDYVPEFITNGNPVGSVWITCSEIPCIENFYQEYRQRIIEGEIAFFVGMNRRGFIPKPDRRNPLIFPDALYSPR